MNPHPRIDVGKFNGTNNFGMWRCEVMDALNASNLEDTLLLEKKRSTTTQEEWDKMNRSACGLIRSCLTQDIKYLCYTKHLQAVVRDPRKKVSDQNY